MSFVGRRTTSKRLWLASGFTVVLVTHDVDEAIALADRVILIDAGRVGLDVRVELPRSRHRGSTAFGEMAERVLDRVMQKTDARS